VDKVRYGSGAQASGLFLSRGWRRRRAAGRVRRTSGVDDRVNVIVRGVFPRRCPDRGRAVGVALLVTW